MPDDTQERGGDLISRRQFLDVLSKSVIATATFSLVAMTDRTALAAGHHPGGPGPNPYHPYGDCGKNPYHPYNPYGCAANPYHPYYPYGCSANPYHPYNPYHTCVAPAYHPYNPYHPYTTNGPSGSYWPFNQYNPYRVN